MDDHACFTELGPFMCPTTLLVVCLWVVCLRIKYAWWVYLGITEEYGAGRPVLSCYLLTLVQYHEQVLFAPQEAIRSASIMGQEIKDA